MSNAIKINLPDWAKPLGKKYIDKIREEINEFLSEDTCLVNGSGKSVQKEILSRVEYDNQSKTATASKKTGIVSGSSSTGASGNMYDSWETEYEKYDIYLKGKLIGSAFNEVKHCYVSFEDGSKSNISLNRNGKYDDMGLADERGPIADIDFDKDIKITHKKVSEFKDIYDEEVILSIYGKLLEQAIEKGVKFKCLENLNALIILGGDPKDMISIYDICPTNFLETVIRYNLYEIIDGIAEYSEVDPEIAFIDSGIYGLNESPTGLTIIVDNYHPTYGDHVHKAYQKK